MIARAGFGDLSALADLDRLCFPTPTAFGRATLLYYLYLPNCVNFVERSPDGMVRGFVIASHQHVSTPHAGDYVEGHIVTLDVHPEFRRHGTATRLMDRAIEKLRNAGAAEIALEVGVTNVAAIKLYEGFGFRVCGLLKDYYANGRALQDAYRMQLVLG